MATAPPTNTASDKEDKNRVIIAIFIAAGLVIAAAGAIAWSLTQGKNQPDDQIDLRKEINVGPAETDTKFPEKGAIQIEPPAMTMVRDPAGTYSGSVSLTITGQPTRIENIEARQITGARIRSTCSDEKTGRPREIQPGQRCVVTMTVDINVPGNGFSGTPTLQIQSITKTPGGNDATLNYDIPVTGVDGPLPIAGFSRTDPFEAPPGSTMPGASGIDSYRGTDPYSPPPGLSTRDRQTLENWPDSRNNPATLPAEAPNMNQKEIFEQARRQPALTSGQILPSRKALAAPQDIPTDIRNWDGLNIPSSRSSLPVQRTRVLTMDRTITAVLTRPIDSRQPIQVTAQVDRNVYSAHGRTILIPRGSTLIGQIAGGSDGRLAIAWQQIIRPDGARFVFEGSSGDSSGAGGVPGIVNERNMKRYGGILLGTALNAGLAAALGAETQVVNNAVGTTTAQNTGAIVTDIVRQDMQRIINDLVDRATRIQTIVTVPAGTRIVVVPTMDLILAPAGGYRQVESQAVQNETSATGPGMSNFEPAVARTGARAQEPGRMAASDSTIGQPQYNPDMDAMTAPSARPEVGVPPPPGMTNMTIRPSQNTPSWARNQP